MSVEQMRSAIAKVYPGKSWQDKVKKMADGQVIRIYYKFLEEKRLKQMLKVSETLIIGIDITQEDESVITVAKSNGSTLTHVNTITGQEAEDLYKKLTNK